MGVGCKARGHLYLVSTEEHVGFEVVEGFVYDVLIGGLTREKGRRTPELRFKGEDCCVTDGLLVVQEN